MDFDERKGKTRTQEGLKSPGGQATEYLKLIKHVVAKPWPGKEKQKKPSPTQVWML